MTGSVHRCNFPSFRGIGVASCPHCATGAGYVFRIFGQWRERRRQVLKTALRPAGPGADLQAAAVRLVQDVPYAWIKVLFRGARGRDVASHVPRLMSLETSGTTFTFCFCLFLI